MNHKKIWQNSLKVLPFLFTLFILTICVLTIRKELKTYGWQNILEHWETIPEQQKLLAIALTFCGYLIMTAYDFLVFCYIQQTLTSFKIAFTAFLSYAIGNTVGFTALSGTAIRYRFYGNWKVPHLKIAKLILFTHLGFWLGICGVSGITFAFDHVTLPKVLKLPFETVRPLGLIFLGIIVIYFVLTFLWKRPITIKSESIILPSPSLSLSLILVSAIDWGLASAVLYVLLPSNFPISYAGFFGIYLIAMVAGLISTVPGGLGVFETVILLLRPDSVTAPAMLGALLAYRCVYYFLPLFVAIILLLVHFWQSRRHQV